MICDDPNLPRGHIDLKLVAKLLFPNLEISKYIKFLSPEKNRN